MLDIVSKGFQAAKNRLKGFQEITEKNIEDAVREIRVSLLEADVSYNVVKSFIERVKNNAIGEIVKVKAKTKDKKIKISPSEYFVKICQDELEKLMGPVDTSIKRDKSGFGIIMMVGLQGSGKTTTSAKLANLLKEDGHKVLLVAGDIYRPAAIDQLKKLGERIDVPVFYKENTKPPEMAEQAINFAKKSGFDTVIIDTAGRLAIDEVLMQELEEMKEKTKSQNIFLVVDAMIGQDAVKTATEFNRRLDIDGVILTKLDGDARGGAALSIKEVTGKPIKFVGMGEKMHQLEPFRPEGLASRILGLGDIVGLVKDFERVVDEEKAEEEAKKILKGQFNFYQFREQIQTLKKMGSIVELMEKMPMFQGRIPEDANIDEKEIFRIEAMINSMTHEERLHPEILNESRIRRIAKGSGTTPKQVEEMIVRFKSMKKIFKQIGKSPSLLSRIPGIKQLMQMKDLKNLDPSMFNMDELMMPKKKKRPEKKIDRAKLKKLRKMQKKARKKSRKKK